MNLHRQGVEKASKYFIFLHQNHIKIITPSGFIPSTKINENGGKSFWVTANKVYFANKRDQRIYQLEFKDGDFTDPESVTERAPDGFEYRYADLVTSTNFGVLCIVECHSTAKHQTNEEKPEKRGATDSLSTEVPVFSICQIDDSGKLTPLISGADFYANLVSYIDSTTGVQKIAWMEWSHPNLPWNDSRLSFAIISSSYDRQLKPNIESLTLDDIEIKNIVLGERACVSQLSFTQSGVLLFCGGFS